MLSAREKVIELVNKFQAIKYDLSISFFGSKVHVGLPVPFKERKPFEAVDYIPEGATALYSAVYTTLLLAKRQKGKHLVIILCDGPENASLECSGYLLKDFIERLDDSWTIVYVGANQDAWEEAAKIGIRNGNTSIYRHTPKGLDNATRILIKNMEEFMDAPVSSTAYFFSSADIDSLKHTT